LQKEKEKAESSSITIKENDKQKQENGVTQGKNEKECGGDKDKSLETADNAKSVGGSDASLAIDINVNPEEPNEKERVDDADKSLETCKNLNSVKSKTGKDSVKSKKAGKDGVKSKTGKSKLREVGDDQSKDSPYIRPLIMKDFQKAIKEISSSVSEDAFAIAELRKWNELYGEGGSRHKPTLTYFT